MNKSTLLLAPALALAMMAWVPAHAANCANGGQPPCAAHREPGPSHPHNQVSSAYHGPKNTGRTTSPQKPPTFTAAKKQTVGPGSPGPIHTGTHAQTAGSKAALNPQPIPPGHTVTGSMMATHPQTAAPKPAPADPISH